MSSQPGFNFDSERYPRLTIESTDRGTVITILASELKDERVLTEVEEQIVDFVKRHTPQRLVLDFRQVKFMSSMWLRSLIRIRDWVVGNNGQLKLASLAPHLREVFRITQLEGRLFHLYVTSSAALAAFGT